ncbi:MAG: phosphocholine cytidylyltransferase family protein [Planctomycetota bacterium]|jgi:choline kinase|nr:phosphocholine cytidylyltransferase family protein [Planctomycetota bacterium]
MAETIGVILAAGRGSRMKGLTEAKPKCLLELGGRALLEWQLDSMKQAGVDRMLVVTGYRGDLLRGDFETVANPRWESTNMVQSLLYTYAAADARDMIVSYADIVYRPSHVAALLASNADMAVTYDTEWRSLWELRNEDPLTDAETFREEDGKVTDIGGKPRSLDEVRGQYMGLLRFSPAGRRTVADCVSGLAPEAADKLDMTSLLRALLAQGREIGAVPVAGGWCECDTEGDIAAYERRLAEGEWDHDWRR